VIGKVSLLALHVDGILKRQVAVEARGERSPRVRSGGAAQPHIVQGTGEELLCYREALVKFLVNFAFNGLITCRREQSSLATVIREAVEPVERALYVIIPSGKVTGILLF
jgi:hypothetical protein